MVLLSSLLGCSAPESETLRFAHGPADVEVTFHGEVSDAQLFGAGASLLDEILPLNEAGRSQGNRFDTAPGWLRFEYRIDDERREVLVAKRPLMNRVSWNDLARAGAALGDGASHFIGGQPIVQDAQVTDTQGNGYRVRLPTCGQSTLGDLSEWNLLIGAVHRGDRDFAGERYGWIRKPYGDKDLKVGYNGSLSLCQDSWLGGRVMRGYFFVSRFHADDPEVRSTRLYWRPVLERVLPDAQPQPRFLDGDIYAPIRWSPSGRVGFAGAVRNAELFGESTGIADLLPVEGGELVDSGQPEWLRFLYQGKTLLVAAGPIKRSVTWDAIARAGAVMGDDSRLRVGWRRYRQGAQVEDAEGNRYRVRLLSCGTSTMDLRSEWNALIGGIHRGDGDFRPYPEGPYGWLNPPLEDLDVSVGEYPSATTWCQERIKIKRRLHAVNRGYLTVSRFHATETDYVGSGFVWRPVLEAIP